MGQLYTNLNFLRYIDHIAILHERRVAAPVHKRIKLLCETMRKKPRQS